MELKLEAGRPSIMTTDEQGMIKASLETWWSEWRGGESSFEYLGNITWA